MLNLNTWIRKFDLMSLRLLLSVSEERNVGRAAARESIAASAVTKRIHDLEDTLGFQLFYRDARGTRVTPAGEIVERHVRRALQAIDDLHRELSEFAGEAQGHIRIWASDSALSKYLSADLGTFAASKTGISFEVKEGTSAEVLRAVEVGAADIGICTAPAQVQTKLVGFPYRHDALVAVMSPHHPMAGADAVSLTELLATDLVGWSAGSGLMAILNSAAETLGASFKPKYSVSSLEAGRSLVRAGLAVAIEPEGLAGPLEKDPALCVRRISDPWARRNIFIFWASDRPPAAATRALTAHLLGEDEQLMPRAIQEVA